MKELNWESYPLTVSPEEMIPFDMARAERIAERTRALYSGKTKTMIAIECAAWETTQKVPDLNLLRLPEDMEAFLDTIAVREYQMSKYHEKLDDDWLHAAKPRYGIAEMSAFLGGKVDFATDTTYQHPICAELSDFRNLKLDRDNLWLRLVMDGLDYMQKKWGKYVPICMRGSHGPSDLANAIRGNDIFYDIYEAPDELHELMHFCAQAVRWYTDQQRALVTPILDGIISGFGMWMPGRCMGHIGDDLSTMLSEEAFEEHFLPSLLECVDGYDSVFLHTHSLGHRMLPKYAAIDQIDIIEISNDPNTTSSAEAFRQYHDVLANKVAMVRLNYEELLSIKDCLGDSRVYLCVSTKNEEEAKRALELVEKYR